MFLKKKRKRFSLECAVWEITLACNLRCIHCGSSAGVPRENELNTRECLKVCNDLAEVGCKEVSLMGGEPLVRKDFWVIGEYIKDLGMELSIVSNGVLIDKYLNKIVNLEPCVVGISLDGMKETHDKIRGKGVWEKAIKAIELLSKEGLQVTVITTISKINYRDLPKMKDLLLDKEINWQIQLAMPFGNFNKKFMLSEKEFYLVAIWIAKWRKEYGFKRLPVIGAHCFGYFSKVLPGSEWNGCSAGISSIGITSDGNVVGCLSMAHDKFVEGNLREKSLIDIWENPKSFYYNRCFNENMLGEFCKNCKHAKVCKGGCNAMSYTITGKFHNDPYCFYRIEKEILKLI